MIDTLGDILRNNALKFPDEIAYRLRRPRVTYSHQHHDRANRLASALWKSRHQAAGSGLDSLAEHAGVHGDLSRACELAGFIAATVNLRLAPPEIAYILNGLDARDPVLRGAICRASSTNSVDGLPRHRRLMSALAGLLPIGRWLRGLLSNWRSRGRAEPSGARRHHASDLYERHDRPAQRRHAQPQGDIAIAQLMATELGLIVSDRLQLMMPVFHVGCALSPACGASARGRVILHRDFKPADIVATMVREKVTMTHMAPTMVQAVLNVPGIEDGRPLRIAHLVLFRRSDAGSLASTRPEDPRAGLPAALRNDRGRRHDIAQAAA